MISRSVSSSRSDVGSSASSSDGALIEGTRDDGAPLLAGGDFSRIGIDVGSKAELIEQLGGRAVGAPRHPARTRAAPGSATLSMIRSVGSRLAN